jgi:predicted nucleic acid-binding protein
LKRFVVDASVAIKWVLTESHSEAALRLLNKDYELLVPDFFFPEIGNILWKRIRWGETTLDLAQHDLNALMEGDLQIFPSFFLMPEALEIATSVGQAVYDCVYLTLAKKNQCQMVTADERFYNSLFREPLSAHLMWVEDIPQ